MPLLPTVHRHETPAGRARPSAEPRLPASAAGSAAEGVAIDQRPHVAHPEQYGGSGRVLPPAGGAAAHGTALLAVCRPGADVPERLQLLQLLERARRRPTSTAADSTRPSARIACMP